MVVNKTRPRCAGKSDSAAFGGAMVLNRMFSFTVFFAAFSFPVVADSDLEDFLSAVKYAKKHEYQYEPCTLETEPSKLQILKIDSASIENFNIELPPNFFDLEEFCGRWSSNNDVRPLYGWRNTTVKISLYPRVSDSDDYLVFSSKNHGLVRSMSFSRSKIVGSFKIVK